MKCVVSMRHILLSLTRKEDNDEIHDEIHCNPGYFLPDDDPSKCMECSVENCEYCSGTKANITCKECFLGFIPLNSICEIDYSLKAVYNTTENDQKISLMHFMYTNNIKEMYIDNNNITEINHEYTFQNIGSHYVYYIFYDGLEDLSYIFYGINELIEVKFTYLFNTSKVTSFNYMFFMCKNLNKIDMSNIDTSSVESMDGMFYSCTSLIQVDVSHFKTKNVNSMSRMFAGCDSLKSLDLSNFDTTNLTFMEFMFQGCHNLTSINLKSFNTSIVRSLEYLFSQCYSLSSIDLRNFNISNVDYIEGMFDGCSSITSLNLSHFVNKNTTKLDYMFYGCSSLKNLDISGFSLNMNVTMFSGLPNGGTIVVEKNFSELIREQIPNDWEFIIKNNTYFYSGY